MPRYYFDISDNGKVSKDTSGSVMADLHEARRQALSLLPAVVSDLSHDSQRHDFTATVRTEDGHARFRTTLSVSSE